MTAFLRALADALLPPDQARACPGGGEIEAVITALAAHPGQLASIAAVRDGEAAFVAATDAVRHHWLEEAERLAPEQVRTLAAAALHAWCADPRVLASFGWRAAPPQPGGHALPATDQATWDRLARVRRRGPIWREAGP